MTIPYQALGNVARSVTWLFSALILWMPLAALPHGNEHATPHSAVTGGLQAPSSERSNAGNQKRLATPVVSPAQGGLWSEVQPWPLVAVHAALLPNGKVLAWDATPDDADDDPHTTDNYTTRVTLWDPITNEHVATNNDTDTDLFCAGSAHLWDGRVLFAGGDSGRAGANGPLSNTNIYDPETNTWRRAPDMQAPRWYSSVAALGNGEMLTFGGGYLPTPAGEVFQFDQTWRPLPIRNPSPNLEDYQWLQATPEGDVLTFGPGNSVSVIDTQGSGEFRAGPRRDDIDLRDYGSYAMFDVGQILVAGGGEATASSVVIATATQQTRDTSPLTVGRRQHDLTIMADGSVLASGGITDNERFVSTTGGTKVVERWDPNTERWDVMNPMFVERQYHSVAMLLPDGRILSAGGGICGDCYAIGYEEMNAEIYSPPYLFAADGSLAERPRLSFVPEQANYSQRVVVGVSDADTIERVHLIKLSSVTHSQNQEQRLVPVEFERFAGSLSLRFPTSRYTTPPGHYLLFAVNDEGVPSIGATIRIGHPNPQVGEPVRHELAANTAESFEYALQPGRLQVAMSRADTLSIYFGATPITATGANADLSAECEPQLIDGQFVCEFTVPTAGLWYLSQRASERTSYQFTTQFLAQTVTPPVDTELPKEPLEPQEPVEPPTGGESPEVTPEFDQQSAPVKVGALNGFWVMLLLGIWIFGRQDSVGILRH